MNQSFWAGFEKQAGILDRLKTWWRGGEKGQEIQKAVERKPPKYFYSKKLNPGHVKALNRSIRHNAKGKDSVLTLNYTKANGEKVTRKVTPYTARGSTVVGFDHHRGAVRSFRVDRIGSMA